MRDKRTADLFGDGPPEPPPGAMPPPRRPAPGLEDNIDLQRVIGQRAHVFDLMKDSKWRTLAEVALACKCSEASASARLRDFRKDDFGAHTVDRRQRDGKHGLYEYRLIMVPR